MKEAENIENEGIILTERERCLTMGWILTLYQIGFSFSDEEKRMIDKICKSNN